MIKINYINTDMKSYGSTDSRGHKSMISYEDVLIHSKSKTTV